MIESPDAAREMACPMVLQAVVGDKQLFASFPLAPLTYHVVLARAGARAENRAKSSRLLKVSLSFIEFSSRWRLGIMHSATAERVGYGKASWPCFVFRLSLGSDPCASERIWCAIQKNWQKYNEVW